MSFPAWRFDLFNGFRAYRVIAASGATEGEPEPVSLPSLRKACALLALLLASGAGETSPREELTEQLWPGDDPLSSRDRFKQTLAVLRRFLEPSGTPLAGRIVAADRFQVGLLAGSLTSDLGEFKAALRLSGDRHHRENPQLARQALERAVSLYTGEFAPGFYEDLLLAERARLSEQRLGALLRLGQLLLEDGHAAAALPYAQAAVAADPLREESSRLLLQTLGGMGRTGEIVRYFREMEQSLRAELGAAPSPALKQLFDSLTRAPEIAPAAMPAVPEQKTSSAPARPLVPPTRFFGRESELAAMMSWLAPEGYFPTQASSVLTLTGPGGTGKTRLALELAAMLSERGQTVFFVPLAEVSEAERIVDRIAETMGVSLPHGESPMVVVARAFAAYSPTPLLILDNFEQVAEMGAATIATLIQEIRSLGGKAALLITSQRRLDIQGEQEFAIEPLPTPHAPGTPERLGEFPSIQLFVDRARSIRPNFALTAANSADIVELCRRLDGLPLAIELAAAWASVLTPAQILQRINRRFSLLVSTRADIPERHRSLRAALGAAVPLLPPDLQRMYARLSVFRGGWTLEAAESICSDSDDDRDQIPLQLFALQRQSLIAAETPERLQESAIRYRMLESLRDYAGEMLSEESLKTSRRRHADYFLGFIRTMQSQLYTAADQPAVLRAMDADMDNIRIAQGFYLESSDILNSLGLSMGLWRYCQIRGNLSLGIEMIEAALQLAAASSEALTNDMRFARAGSLNSLGVLVSDQGDHERCEKFWEASIADYRALGKMMEALRPLSNLATLAIERGDYQAGATRLEEVLAVQRQHNELTGMAYTLTNLGSAKMGLGDYAQAFMHYEESLTLKRAHGNRISMALTLAGLSQTAFHSGRFEMARSYAEEGMGIYRENGDRYRICDCLTTLACVAREERNYPAAAAHFTQILQYQWESGRLRYALTTIECLADVALRAGSVEAAARLWSAAAAMRARHLLTRESSTRQILDANSVSAALKASLSSDDYTREWAVGLMLTDEQVYRHASSIVNSEKVFVNIS